MLSTMLAVMAIAPDFAETNITGATIFRNGYGFVVTETWLDQSGTTLIRALPQAVEGTLWFAPGKYAEINDVTVTMMEVEPVEQTAVTIAEILALNIGKDVSLTVIAYPQEKANVISGKILSVTRQQVLLQTAVAIQAVSFGGIQSLKGQFDDFKTTAETKVSAPVLKVTSEPGSGGSLYIISLISGVTWVPAYNIELKDDSELAMTMKATIINSIGDFKKVDVGLMSGFPDIDGIGSTDPLMSGLQAIFKATEDSTRLAMVRGQTSYGRGGFGGGGGQLGDSGLEYADGLVRGDIKQVTFGLTDNSFITGDADKAFREMDQRLRTTETENFFIYGIDDYEHKSGDRRYMVIDEGDLSYELSHRISSTSGNKELITQRYVVFENGLDVPLTKASAMITRNGELIGKTELPYTYMGDEVELSIGTASYMLSKVATGIEKTNKGKLKLKDKRIFDEIEKVDTITITNLGKRPAKTLIHHRMNGEIFKVTPKAIESKTSTSDAVNFDYYLEWEIEIAPGETKTFEIEYSSYRYVRTDK